MAENKRFFGLTEETIKQMVEVSVEDTKMAYFKNLNSSKPEGEVTLDDVFNYAVTDPIVKALTLEYREGVRQHGKETMKRYKQTRVPSFMSQVRLDGDGKSEKNVTGFTGNVSFDIDPPKGGEPLDVEAMMKMLRADSYVSFAEVSLGGEGIHVMLRAKGIVDKETFKYAQAQAMAYVEKLLGVPVDTKALDIVRSLTISHDPHAYQNRAAKWFEPDYSQMPAPKAKKSVGRPKKKLVEKTWTAIQRDLENRGLKYEEGGRNQYISHAAYMMNRYGVDETEATEWAINEFRDYGDGEQGVRSVFKSCYEHTDEFGTWELGRSGKRNDLSVPELENYLLSVADYRYNVTTNRVEIKWETNTTFRPIEDTDENELWRKANHDNEGCKVMIRDIRQLLGSRMVIEYNPYTEYLDNVAKWDGTDYIGELAARVHLKGEHVLSFSETLKRWLVSMVNGIYRFGEGNQQVLILVGAQGRLKTTFFRKLVPTEWYNGAHTKMNNTFVSKDEQIVMAEHPIIILDEISSMTVNALQFFKSWITQDHVEARKPYAHHESKMQRIASFCGTGNDVDFLIDDTGNRRFLPFEVDYIEDLFAKPIDHQKLYSQVMHLWRNGYRHYYTMEENEIIERHNARFMRVNPIEELIAAQFRKPELGEKEAQAMFTSEIANRISGGGRVQYDASAVGRMLKKMGFVQAPRNSKGTRYFVVEMKGSEITERQKREAESYFANQVKPTDAKKVTMTENNVFEDTFSECPF